MTGHADLSDTMTPEDRKAEVCRIFARAVIRLLTSKLYVRTKSESHELSETSSDSNKES